MKIHRFEVYVIDHESSSMEDCKQQLENMPHLNCLVKTSETADIGPWSDDHELNQRAGVDVFRRYFEKESHLTVLSTASDHSVQTKQAGVTNEELTEIYDRANGHESGKLKSITTEKIFTAMRSCLEKSTVIAFAPDEIKNLQDGFRAGWTIASGWAGREDLIADIASPAYLRDMAQALSPLVNMQNIADVGNVALTADSPGLQAQMPLAAAQPILPADKNIENIEKEEGWYWVRFDSFEGLTPWIPAKRERNHWNSLKYGGIPCDEVVVGEPLYAPSHEFLTLLEENDLHQSEQYQKGRADGRNRGYEVGYRHAVERLTQK